MEHEADHMQPQQFEIESYVENVGRLPNTVDDHEGSDQQFEWVYEERNFTDADSSSKAHLTLHFVAETGKSRPHGTVRNLIRSHARRSRAKRSRVAGTDLLLLREEEEKNIRGQSVKSRVRWESIHHKERFQNMQVDRGPGNNAFDAFSVLPVDQQQGHALALVNHYIHAKSGSGSKDEKVFRHSYAPMHPRAKWLSFAISDPALLSATLFTSALSLCLLHGKSSNPDVIYHLGETIRQINKALCDPTRRVTNANICAVACLTLFESLSGSAVRVKIHADGLETMVNSRGGLESIWNAEFARRLTTWIDSCSSIVMETKPRFEPFEFVVVEGPPDRTKYSSLAIRYKDKLFNLTGLQDLSEETIDVYWSLRNLSALKEVASCHPDQNVEMVFYGDMLEQLERRVFRMVQQDALLFSTTDLVIYRLFGYAVLLHIYLFMRDLPRGLGFFHLLSGRLRRLLEGVDIQILYIRYPEMMLWILIMGGLGGIGTSSRGWFANLVSEACSVSGLRGGNELAFTLAEFLWSELYRSPVTMGFWNDVAMAQGTDRGYEVRRFTDHVVAATFNAPPDIVD